MTTPVSDPPYRPVVAVPGVTKPRLVVSLADAIEFLGDGVGGTFYHFFANGHGMRGVWVVPHPDHPETVGDQYASAPPHDGRGFVRVPLYSKVNSAPGEFTTHDTSQGHCGLCGRLGCPGSCFK